VILRRNIRRCLGVGGERRYHHKRHSPKICCVNAPQTLAHRSVRAGRLRYVGTPSFVHRSSPTLASLLMGRGRLFTPPSPGTTILGTTVSVQPPSSNTTAITRGGGRGGACRHASRSLSSLQHIPSCTPATDLHASPTTTTTTTPSPLWRRTAPIGVGRLLLQQQHPPRQRRRRRLEEMR
jgi:hypothetical protein